MRACRQKGQSTKLQICLPERSNLHLQDPPRRQVCLQTPLVTCNPSLFLFSTTTLFFKLPCSTSPSRLPTTLLIELPRSLLPPFPFVFPSSVPLPTSHFVSPRGGVCMVSRPSSTISDRFDSFNMEAPLMICCPWTRLARLASASSFFSRWQFFSTSLQFSHSRGVPEMVLNSTKFFYSTVNNNNLFSKT